MGQLISRTFVAVKRGFWPLFGIQVIGLSGVVVACVALVILVPLGFLFVAIAFSGFDSFKGIPDLAESLPTAQWILLLAGFAIALATLYVLSFLPYVKAVLAAITGASRLLAGERPTLSQMWRDSSGSFRRSTPLLIGWTLFNALVAFLYMYVALDAMRAGRMPAESRTALSKYVFVGAFALIYALLIATPYLAIRWTYVGHALVLERAGSIRSLRRSWQLTSRNFFRTLVSLLVLLVAVGVAFLASCAILWLLSVSLQGIGVGKGVASTPGEIQAAILTDLFVVIAVILHMAIIAVLGVFTAVYTTAMYRDQCYRASLKEQGIDLSQVASLPQASTGSLLPPHAADHQPPPDTTSQPTLAPGSVPQHGQERSPWARP